MVRAGSDPWSLAGVSPQVWDRIQSEAAVSEDERAAEARSNRDAVWVLERVGPKARLLDLGCGSGRLMELHMARQNRPEEGWALGIDLSWPALLAARRRLLAGGFQPRLVRANLVDLQCVRGAGLDAAACLFSTLGMIRGYGNRLRFLKGVQDSLKPGGILILHAHARWWHLTSAPGRSWLLRDLWARWTGKEHAGEYRSLQSPHHAPSLGHFTKGELVHLVKMAGFTPYECARVEGHVEAVGKTGTKPPWYSRLLPAHGWLLAARRD